MNSFNSSRLKTQMILPATSWLLGQCMECRGKEALWMRTQPETLERLREFAIIQSAESSNRIEGVTVEPYRLVPLLSGKVSPQDRDEQEIFGYRKALDWIHLNMEEIEINPDTIKHIHSLCLQGSASDAGKWKKKNNDIIEVDERGNRSVMFKTLGSSQISNAMDQLCLAFQDAKVQEQLPDLLTDVAFVFDFLCIHPFRDGNGRVSRLLSLILLYKRGYGVGKYISLERLVEENKEDYHSTLKRSSSNWHESKHELHHFFHFFLQMVREAYRRLAHSIQINKEKSGGLTGLVHSWIQERDTPFTLRELSTSLPQISEALLKKVLSMMKNEGSITLSGRGRGAVWRKGAKRR